MTAAPRVPLLPVAVAAAIVTLGFAAVTGHAWEDYFITFRSSLHLAQGHGLVYQPGERIHSFTSPLGTLLPALFALGGGDGVELRALWGLRIVSARGRVGNRWSDVVADLKPEWLVLRPWDAERIFGERPALARYYAPARTFDVRAAVEDPDLLPGRGFPAFDAVFHAFQRRSVPIPATAP